MDDKSFNIRVPKRWVRMGMVALVTAVIVAPLTAIAAHTFTDVPDTNTFHEDIAWLKDAGVTLGCNPPTNTQFCPKDNVTREQMSAFMRRLAENKVVDAATAVEADNATTADSATTASTADDAGTVDGYDSSGLVRIATTTVDNISPEANGERLTVELTAPTDGVVAVNGLLELFNNQGVDNSFTCEILLDGTTTPPGVEWQVENSAGEVNTQCMAQSSFNVAAGTYTIGISVSGLLAGDNIGDGSLTAIFTPFQGDGSQATPSALSGSAGGDDNS